MEQDLDYTAIGMGLLAGFALGALTMYLLDPDRGNRRRAAVRDTLHSAAVNSRKVLDAQARDLANRAQGIAAEARNAVWH